MPIHPTAIVDSNAEIDATADVGPYVTIDGPVKIGPGTKVYPNAYLSGWTEIGANCQIHPGAVVGHVPQDFHFPGERSYCRIGDGTIIREFASIHRGTQPESWTLIGKECFILGYAHVGHNCELGDGVKLYNCAALSGHVIVGNQAVISGYSLTHQFVRIGPYVMVGGGTRLGKDVPPYFMAVGESACVGYNSIGLRRSGAFSRDAINEVKNAYRILYRSGLPFSQAVEELASKAATDAGKAIVEFFRAPSKRGIIGPPRPGGPTDVVEGAAEGGA
ncbi:MAG: acyl-ACP--UDP-N-acetylglucosamine O-acyltransferase [Phycisphaerae bacterium]